MTIHAAALHRADSKSCASSVPPAPEKFGFLLRAPIAALVVALLALPATVAAQQAPLFVPGPIDSLLEPSFTNVQNTDLENRVIRETEDLFFSPGSSLFGQWRRVDVFGDGPDTGASWAVSAGFGGGQLTLAADAASEAAVWRFLYDDSTLADLAAAYPSAPNDGQFLEFDGDGVVTSGLIADGLATPLDFTGICPGGQDEFSLTVERPSNVDSLIRLTLYLFSANNAWASSEQTYSGSTGTPYQVVRFPLDDFSNPANQGGTALPDLTSISAVVVEFRSEFQNSGDLTGNSTHIIRSAVGNCGYDFGRAPDARDLTQSDPAADFYYNTRFQSLRWDTLSSSFPTARGLLGAGHRIGGPWIGNGADFQSGAINDTDSETSARRCAQGDQGPSGNACGDAGDNISDESISNFEFPTLFGRLPGDPPLECDGVVVDENQYCVAVDITNPIDRSSTLAGWIDFDRAGSFRWRDCGQAGDVQLFGTPDSSLTTAQNSYGGCHRSQPTILIGNTGLQNYFNSSDSNASGWLNTAKEINCDADAALISDGSWISGNIPPNCTGTVVLVWDFPESFDQSLLTVVDTWSRFRITSDRGIFSAVGGQTNQPQYSFFTDTPPTSGSPIGPVPFGLVEDGEVEDHYIPVETLPVSIHRFDSQWIREGLEVSWATVSETLNAGFYLWGDTGEGMELLTPDMIPSDAEDAVKPQQYRIVIPESIARGVKDLAISAADVRGDEEMYGLFAVGDAYGRDLDPKPVDWTAIRSGMESRLQARNVELAGGNLRSRTNAAPDAVDFEPSTAGVQRISYEDLLAQGLDLRGVSAKDIAVTLKGRGVPRSVNTGSNSQFQMSTRFGPGSSIDFWAEKPTFPDALYIENFVYRVAVDPSHAIAAVNTKAQPADERDSHTRTMVVNEDIWYRFSTMHEDPWYALRLRANSSNDTYTTTIDVPATLDSARAASVTVGITGYLTHGLDPEHHVELLVNGSVAGEAFFAGRTHEKLTFDLAPGTIQAGLNEISVRAPGGTAAPSDHMLLDTVSLSFASSIQAEDNRVMVSNVDPGGAVRATGFADASTIAYAKSGDKLYRLKPRLQQRGTAVIPTIADPDAEYWISTAGAVHRPVAVGGVAKTDLLAEQGDLLVIAHPAFLPVSAGELHPLNAYVQARESQGWSVAVYDALEIQKQFGAGMALPDAFNAFLKAAAERFDYSHVLIVGDENYDYLDKLGLGTVSFVPTYYEATRLINHTPSDGLLADLDGDGVPDRAIGRWPVRTQADLEATVQKALDWQGMQNLQTAVWVTDAADHRHPSFEGQVERMVAPLVDAGWMNSSVDRIIFEDMIGASGGAPAATRDSLILALEDGRSLTGFTGHASPAMWSFQSILDSEDVGQINNIGKPTMISALSCYTSYMSSPHSDTIAHRMMNGYLLDDFGDVIPGAANGAVAIHGAATLSSYAQNEWFAKLVLENQLSGMTIGEAIQDARVKASARGIDDLVINWTLLGDPTLRLQ